MKFSKRNTKAIRKSQYNWGWTELLFGVDCLGFWVVFLQLYKQLPFHLVRLIVQELSHGKGVCRRSVGFRLRKSQLCKNVPLPVCKWPFRNSQGHWHPKLAQVWQGGTWQAIQTTMWCDVERRVSIHPSINPSISFDVWASRKVTCLFNAYE